uniref:Uncharacterized protein n=1 Tax=Oryza brachyantha TaxID=4533 RepID=J3LXA4_ORYBR
QKERQPVYSIKKTGANTKSLKRGVKAILDFKIWARTKLSLLLHIYCLVFSSKHPEDG